LSKTAAAKKWSQLMTLNLSFFKSETAQRLRAEGEAQGEARGEVKMAVDNILDLLRNRGITIPSDAEQQIRSCDDTTLLRQWFRQAMTATTISEVLA
jgi:hypothetical protein